MDNELAIKLIELLSTNNKKAIYQDLEFLAIKYNRLINTKRATNEFKPCSLFKKNYLKWEQEMNSLEQQINDTLLDIEKCINDIDSRKN